MKFLAIAFIKLYQLCLSPFVGNSCKFVPSCSTYAIQAIEKHGIFKGTYLAAWRILRCNPWSLGGSDDP